MKLLDESGGISGRITLGISVRRGVPAGITGGILARFFLYTIIVGILR